MKKISIIMFAFILVCSTVTLAKNDHGIGVGVSSGLHQTSEIFKWRNGPHISVRKYWKKFGVDVALSHSSISFDGNDIPDGSQFGLGAAFLVRLRNTANVNVNLPIGVGFASYKDAAFEVVDVTGTKKSVILDDNDFGLSVGLEYEWFPYVADNDDGRFSLKFDINYGWVSVAGGDVNRIGFDGATLGFSYYFGNPGDGYYYSAREQKQQQPVSSQQAPTPEPQAYQPEPEPAPAAPAAPDMNASYHVMVQGQKYGPASVDTLRQWKNQGRILDSMTIIDANTGTKYTVGDLFK